MFGDRMGIKKPVIISKQPWKLQKSASLQLDTKCFQIPYINAKQVG